jgi:type II secretory pathway pseudopilin PulG
MSSHRANSPRGFTLVEAVIATALLVLVAAAVLQPFQIAATLRDEEAHRTSATFLAEQLMEEILARPFDDPDGDSAPGPESDESTRADYDNVDDYHGHTEPAGQLTDATGEAIDDTIARDLNRSATVEYVYVDQQSGQEDPTIALVTVSVFRAGQRLVRLSRLVRAPDGEDGP